MLRHYAKIIFPRLSPLGERSFQRADLLKASTEGVFQQEEGPMAQFCTKCGTPLPEGMRFCTGCGAVIGEAAAPSTPAATAAPLAHR